MSRRRPVASLEQRASAWVRVLGAALGAVLAVARPLTAQVTITVPVVADSISPAPVIAVLANPLPAELQPSTITLALARDSSFSNPLFVQSAPGSAGSFIFGDLLPERTRIFFRARILDARGTIRGQQITSFVVRSWLRLVTPTRTSNDVLFTRQPTFVWSSPTITLPPGPWSYTIDVINTATGIPAFEILNLRDTVFVPTTPLDACTSFKWRIQARAENGGPADVVVANSPGTFVIQSAECPTATIFYQNFPNPFGRGAMSPVTCFWFDLARPSEVTLIIYDIRLRLVRHIVPGALAGVLNTGAYGRQNDVSLSGCDTRLQWDGRDDNGRPVPPGVYIAVFTGDGVRTTKKILFKGS